MSRIKALLIILIAMLATEFACTATQTVPVAASQNRHCVGFDYGSGMVAMLLAPADADILTKLHDITAADTTILSRSLLARQPYRPHISVIYGVTPDNQAAIIDALHQWAQTAPPLPMRLGSLTYWDDVPGEKTTLVARVDELGRHVLVDLHRALSRSAGLVPRQPFNPHITLAFLAAGLRLPPATEQDVVARLSKFHAKAATVIVTDACGTTVESISLN